MKLNLTKLALIALLQNMADCKQESANVDVVEDGEEVKMLYTIEGGKVIPKSEATVAPVEVKEEVPESDSDQNPGPDLTDSTALLALKMEELKSIASSLGLSTDGKKPELVNAIVEKAKADQSQ